MDTPSIPARNRVGHSIRRGSHALGQLIGGYFGVTEESQQSHNGWSDVAQRRAEEGPVGFGTLGRRRSSNRDELPPPDYNTLEMGERGLGRSFDIDELSSDSNDSDEDVFPGEPPPDYPALFAAGGVEPARISMFGHEDPTRARQPQNIQPVSEAAVTNGRASDEDGYIRDPDQGVRYFLNYIRAEKAIRQRRNLAAADEFFGGGRERLPSDAHAAGRRGRLNSTVEERERRKKKNKKGRSKLERQNTLVRDELKSLPTFWPIFIIGVTFVQVAIVVILIVLENLAPIHYEPEKHTSNYPSLFNMSGNASVTYYTFTNLWIGIGLLDLIHSGVKFTPCMRKDVAIINRNLQQRNREEDGEGLGLGCCQNKVWVGTVIMDECVVSEHPDLNNTDFDFDSSPCKDSDRFLANFHPCCISITGQCKVMHIRECTDRGGVFHSDKDSCNDTNCLDSICGLGGVGQEDGDPARPVGTQIWRLITSLFIHLGLIHIAVVGVIQFFLGYKIERTAGFIRVALIYIISGVGGNLMSAIFIPYQVNGGASPAIFGLLSVVFVELFQFWQLIDHAWLEVVKLSSVFIFLLAFGTLPFIDNLANLGGFLFGIPSSIIFLPYITFGKVDAWRKRVLLIICIPLLILMFLVGLIVFYLVPDTDFCEGCHYFNCIPFTSSFCQNEVNDPDPEIFAL